VRPRAKPLARGRAYWCRAMNAFLSQSRHPAQRTHPRRWAYRVRLCVPARRSEHRFQEVDGTYRSGLSRVWIKVRNPASIAVRRERSEIWNRGASGSRTGSGDILRNCPPCFERSPHSGNAPHDAIIPLRTSPRCARAPQILPPMWNRCASASPPISESRAARAQRAGCLETLIWPYFREAYRPPTLSPGCSHVSSALGLDGQPLRKPPRAENLQPVVHAPPRGLLNPGQTNTSFPRDLPVVTATSRGILDAQPRPRSQMKGIPSCQRLMPWRGGR
jgi:hypothetical protein